MHFLLGENPDTIIQIIFNLISMSNLYNLYMGSKQEIQHYEQITYMLFIQLIDSTQLFSLSIPKRS